MQKKKIKKIAIIASSVTGGLILLFFAAGFIIANFYGNEISKFIISEINKNLKTEIKVGKVNFSVFKHFPDASVEFQDVYAKPTKGFNRSEFKGSFKDTLFSAQSLFLQFNIIDIYYERYKIKKIIIEKGRMYLLTNSRGKENYHFWESSHPTDTSKFQLCLKKITLNNVQVFYIDNALHTDLRIHSRNFVLNGDFSSDDYSLSTAGELFADCIVIDNVNYVNASGLAVNLTMKVKNNLFEIKNGSIDVEDLSLNVTGTIQTGKKNIINLQIKGNDIDIQSFLSLLPEKFDAYKKEYQSEGELYFEANVSGAIDSSSFVHIETKFGMKNASISKKNASIKLKNVSLTGLYSNGENNSITTTTLLLDRLKFTVGKSNISGSFFMKNPEFPHVEINAEVDAQLSELQQFFKVDTIREIDGIIKSNFNFSGRIKDPSNFTKNDFMNSKISGNLILENASFSLKEGRNKYTGINGIFAFNNNDLDINSLSFYAGNNDFSIKGALKNIISYFMVPDQHFLVDGEVTCANLNMNELLAGKSDQNKSEFIIALPDNMEFYVSTDIKNFIFSDFQATDVKGKLLYKNRKLNAEDIHFKTMEGSIESSGVITQENDGNFSIHSKIKLSKINIQKLFISFNNFGQDFITDKHLRGFVSSDITIASEWTNALVCNTKKLIVASNVTINNGELIDFKPLEKMAQFVDINELKNIRFSELKNDILIKDEKIIIPQMDINSSALNLSLLGEQTFDSRVDYRVKILLSDILSKKIKSKKKEKEEFGPIEEDDRGKTNIYLVISGTTDNFSIRYDTRKVKESIKEAVKDEKKTIKSILKEEFGLFKNDTSLINFKKKKEEEEKKKKQNKVKIKWDEESEGEIDKSEEK
ncbi:MAG: hypothetical protein A2275_06155 [Bacteroidetes bacterium RIFOXYA12_FULL_35_11]|nr:MAG: hypothetical protein A2X01_01720 [Bacteroidetes bacterium GWF2_35_48]OFY74200.1 MAG: hypothetical protein A2275_06155 [Bacteroidetes bacterium RIFOXYA12_FULL_35_11]OFY93786.1 MAG: hypothetical protein A2491_02595 [Bacteroidetes bacterium RIFOXYC12_FULL_35_7]OFY94718.1 MAG: hypothetical protein A2309_06335 [Bacteroidetes bacterium RIFOXYB2_FULL_35_7]HBX52389.1 hypothetical protein [Bacteroidales bacterium]